MLSHTTCFPLSFTLRVRFSDRSVTGNDLFSQAVSSQVPSALACLTAVFGMGTGGSTQASSPDSSRAFLLSQNYTEEVLTKHFSCITFSVKRSTSTNRASLSLAFLRRFTLVSQALGRLVLVRSTPCRASTPSLLPRRLRGALLLSHEKLHLRAGFTLRCFQRLSLPDAATRLYGWRHNRFTVGPSTPVLSY